VFIRPEDTLESLYGDDWVYVARFNRIDRRHVYPGMTIKSPKNMADIRDYSPLPATYEPARPYDRYILIDMEEQWLGAYEYGVLKFSMPAATGKDGYETPTGVFHADARHRNHTSSLYKVEDQSAQYPMDYAIRFHVGADNVAYWIHARDLPGRPASHGCVGLYDEDMQKRIFMFPDRPVLADAKKLYEWAVGESAYEGVDSGELELLEDGPVVEITGKNPRYLPTPQRAAADVKK
ncbi:MAG: L,D-transpeptidase, partial [Geobacteraceae bacterium]|nr:L,D-transpeptidase [Geobacteraceae bacterium]